MIICGIDPGYDRLGVAMLTTDDRGKPTTVELATCIQTNKKDDLLQRYKQLQTQLHTLIAKYQPAELAIEALFFSKNTTTAMRVAEAKGICIASAIQSEMDVFEYTPNQIKLAVTGHGKASKAQVEKLLRMQLTFANTVSHVDDAMDAVGVALTHAVSRNLSSQSMLSYTG